YHILKHENIARFWTQLRAFREKHKSCAPFTVFSADIFSPSLEASILRGAHMLPLLKELRVDVACYGNHGKYPFHRFDFGEERLRELTAQTDFPWLLSNAFHAASHNAFGSSHDRANSPSPLLASAQRYHIVTLQGFRVGFFGLAGT
ncbi:Metallo-dependent phosphatase, partial [Colletotrichum sublineola]